jgi:hypothetical protein
MAVREEGLLEEESCIMHGGGAEYGMKIVAQHSNRSRNSNNHIQPSIPSKAVNAAAMIPKYNDLHPEEAKRGHSRCCKRV